MDLALPPYPNTALLSFCMVSDLSMTRNSSLDSTSTDSPKFKYLMCRWGEDVLLFLLWLLIFYCSWAHKIKDCKSCKALNSVYWKRNKMQERWKCKIYAEWNILLHFILPVNSVTEIIVQQRRIQIINYCVQEKHHILIWGVWNKSSFGSLGAFIASFCRRAITFPIPVWNSCVKNNF